MMEEDKAPLLSAESLVAEDSAAADPALADAAKHHRRQPRPYWKFISRTLVVLCVVAILSFTYGLGYSRARISHRMPPQHMHPPHYPWRPPPPPGTSMSQQPSIIDGAEFFYSSVNRTKPEGFKIIGLLFFGRRQYTDLLDCYLRRNLVINGGFLDEVHIAVHTEDPVDHDWIFQFVKKHQLEDVYKLFDFDVASRDYSKLWELASDPNTMYIKVDDDVVWVHDDAIPRMVHTLMAHPEAHSIQANIINGARTPYFHFHSDAIHPYLPDHHDPPPGGHLDTTWRVSGLPLFQGSARENFDLSRQPHGHRWLPLEETEQDLGKTPIAQFWNPDREGKFIDPPSWAKGAQEHYSFFQNLEQQTLHRYVFGSDDGVWNLWYRRYNINFMAIWGHTLLDHPLDDFDGGGDEFKLTIAMPKALKMPAKVDTHALVAHFSYRSQVEGLEKTDILAKYRSYANEAICREGNKKVPFDKHRKHLVEIVPPNEPPAPPKVQHPSEPEPVKDYVDNRPTTAAGSAESNIADEDAEEESIDPDADYPHAVRGTRRGSRKQARRSSDKLR